MSKEAILTRLDGLLNPLGFKRKKFTWNRLCSPFIDVIDVQVSSAGDMLTVNAGVIFPDAYTKCWGKEVAEFVEEPFCTVRSRIGQLIEGKDVWWPLDGRDVVNEIVNGVANYVIRFLDEMHSIQKMEQLLIKMEVTKQKFPPPIIYLAILKQRRGDTDGALALLRDLQYKTRGAWHARIGKIAGELSSS